MDGLLAFAFAGFALAGSPGPATLSLAATGAAFGVRRGLGYMAGIVIGMAAVMGIAATGVVSLVLAVPGSPPVVAVLAAIITAVDIAWLFAGAALTRFFREPRINRAINLAFAALLLASVALALLV